MSERHTHRCLRCKQEFPCQTPGICTAKEDVLPRIVLSSGEVVDHCEWQPTERFRAKPCYSCAEGTQRPVEFLVCDHCGDFGVGPGSPQLALINKVELSGYTRGRAESAAEVAQLRQAVGDQQRVGLCPMCGKPSHSKCNHCGEEFFTYRESLADTNERLAPVVRELKAEVAQLRADGQRLTGALEKIAQGWMECAEYSRGIVPDAHLSDTAVFEQCAAELRAALASGDAP